MDRFAVDRTFKGGRLQMTIWAKCERQSTDDDNYCPQFGSTLESNTMTATPMVGIASTHIRTVNRRRMFALRSALANCLALTIALATLAVGSAILSPRVSATIIPVDNSTIAQSTFGRFNFEPRVVADCSGALLFQAAVAKEHFNPSDVGSEPRVLGQKCNGGWAVADIKRPNVGFTDSGTLFVEHGGNWIEKSQLANGAVECGLNRGRTFRRRQRFCRSRMYHAKRSYTDSTVSNRVQRAFPETTLFNS